jgi:hypothetical protein
MLDSSGTRNGWSGSSPVVKKSGPIFVPKRFLGEYYSILKHKRTRLYGNLTLIGIRMRIMPHVLHVNQELRKRGLSSISSPPLKLFPTPPHFPVHSYASVKDKLQISRINDVSVVQKLVKLSNTSTMLCPPATKTLSKCLRV